MDQENQQAKPSPITLERFLFPFDHSKQSASHKENASSPSISLSPHTLFNSLTACDETNDQKSIFTRQAQPGLQEEDLEEYFGKDYKNSILYQNFKLASQPSPSSDDTSIPKFDENTLNVSVYKAHEAVKGVKIVCDYFAHGVDLPLKMINAERLSNIQQVYESYINHPPIQKLYRFKADKNDAWFQAQGWEAVKEIGDRCNDLFSELLEFVKENCHITIKDLNENESSLVLIREELERLEAAWETEKKGLGEKIPVLFLKLLPYLEREIWFSTIANPIACTNIFRQSKMWRVAVLFWYINQSKHIQKIAEENAQYLTHSLSEIDESKRIKKIYFMGIKQFAFYPIQINAQRIICVGPYYHSEDYDEDTSVTDEMNKYNDSEDNNYYCLHGYKTHIIFKLFDSLFTKHQRLLYQKERKNQAISNRHLSPTLDDIFSPLDEEIYDSFITKKSYRTVEIRQRIKRLWYALRYFEKIQVPKQFYDVENIDEDKRGESAYSEITSNLVLKKTAVLAIWLAENRGRIDFQTVFSYNQRRQFSQGHTLFSSSRKEQLTAEIKCSLLAWRFLKNSVNIQSVKPVTADDLKSKKKLITTNAFFAKIGIPESLEKRVKIELCKADFNSEEGTQKFIGDYNNYPTINALVKKNNQYSHSQRACAVLDYTNVLEKHIITRINASNGMVLRAIGNSINNFFGKDFELSSAFFQRIGAVIAQRALTLGNSSMCSIYLADFSQDEFCFEEAGFYSYYLPLHDKKEYFSQQLNEAIKMEDLEQGGQSQSTVVRCLQQHAPLLVTPNNNNNKENKPSNSNNNQAVIDYFPKKLTPKGLLSIPMFFNRRVFGVIQLRAFSHHRHTAQDIGQINRLSQLMSSHYYHHRLFHSLKSIHQEVGKLKIDPEREIQAVEAGYLNPIARLLNNILLAPRSQIWLQNNNDYKQFELKGYSPDNKETEEKTSSRAFVRNLIDVKKQGYSLQAPLLSLLGKNWIFDLVCQQIRLPKKRVGDFLQFFYNKDSPDTTINREQHTIKKNELGTNFLTASGNHDMNNYRKDLFTAFPYHIVFPITQYRRKKENAGKMPTLESHSILARQWRQQDEVFRNRPIEEDFFSYEVVGFISLHSQIKSEFNSNWSAVMQLVNEAIGSALYYLELITTPEKQSFNIARHEMLQRISTISDSIKKQKNTTKYLDVRYQYFSASQGFHQHESLIGDKTFSSIAAFEQWYQAMSEGRKTALIRYIFACLSNQDYFTNFPSDIEKASKELRKIIATKNFSYVGEWENIYLDDVLNNQIRAFDVDLKHRNIVIQKQYQNIRPIKTSRVAVESIFINLLSNIVKYANDNSVVDIKIEGLSLSIENSGIYSAKIANKDIDIFEADVRGDDEVTEIHAKYSRGLGLYIVNTICQQFGYGFRYNHEQTDRQKTYSPRIGRYTFMIEFAEKPLIEL